MGKVQTTCAHCRQIFFKSTSEYNRNVKQGRRHYCSLSCSSKDNPSNRKITKQDIDRIVSHAGNRADVFSPFRFYMRVIKKRKKDKGRKVNVVLRDLKKQWDIQQGICPLTGWKLVPNDGTGLTPTTASIDRIDSSKGYVKGNIRFVSIMANFGKNVFSDNQLIAFCQAVVYNLKKNRPQPLKTGSPVQARTLGSVGANPTCGTS